jgi:hypothetical protein
MKRLIGNLAKKTIEFAYYVESPPVRGLIKITDTRLFKDWFNTKFEFIQTERFLVLE